MSKLSEFEKWLGKEFDPKAIKNFTQGDLVDLAAFEGWKACLNRMIPKSRRRNIIEVMEKELEKLKGNIDEKD